MENKVARCGRQDVEQPAWVINIFRILKGGGWAAPDHRVTLKCITGAGTTVQLHTVFPERFLVFHGFFKFQVLFFNILIDNEF